MSTFIKNICIKNDAGVVSFLISCVGGREGITRDDRLAFIGTGAGRAHMNEALSYFLVSALGLRLDVSHAARRPAVQASGASASLAHLCSRLQVWCQSTGWMWGRARSSAFTSSSRWRVSSSPSPWSCQGGWEAEPSCLRSVFPLAGRAERHLRRMIRRRGGAFTLDSLIPAQFKILFLKEEKMQW